jgi:NAD(P)-dependent dehydrogenase (short-subunit alcohol dehydrogenase family)
MRPMAASPRRLAGRIAIVTGAGRGIGRAIAARFLDEGARVVIAERDRAAGSDAADELAGRGEVKLVVTDVAVESQVAAAVEAAVAWGGLHVVVNNAAIADPHSGPIELIDAAEWRRLLDVNLTGPVLVTKHAVPHLRTGGGAIINLTSTRAFQSEPHTEAYVAAKGGIVALTHALAMSLGPAIRVNAIAPGWIATDAWAVRAERKEPALRDVDQRQHPVGRVGRPEDIAALAAYLASDEAGFVTGQTFVVDGGMSRKMIYAE